MPDLSAKVINENAWIHISCALWIPEVIIGDFAKKDDIKSN